MVTVGDQDHKIDSVSSGYQTEGRAAKVNGIN